MQKIAKLATMCGVLAGLSCAAWAAPSLRNLGTNDSGNDKLNDMSRTYRLEGYANEHYRIDVGSCVVHWG